MLVPEPASLPCRFWFEGFGVDDGGTVAGVVVLLAPGLTKPVALIEADGFFVTGVDVQPDDWG